MTSYFKKCIYVALATTLVVWLLATTRDALSVFAGAGIILLDFWSVSQLTTMILKGRSPETSGSGSKLLMGFAFFLKILVVFAAIAAACYFLNPIFVVLGLMSLVVGVTWQALLGLRQQSQPVEQ